MLTVGAQTPPLADQVSYRVALEAARGLTRAQSWSRARTAWLELVKAHAGAAYVQPELEEIRLQLRRASFWASTRAPNLDDLLSGELQSYEPESGWLKLRYNHESLGDFAKGTGAAGAAYAHPAHFKGPWTITLEGTAAEVALPTCLISEGDGGHGLRFGKHEQDFGAHSKHVLFEFDSSGNKEVASSDPPASKDKLARVAAEIHVEANSIRAYYEGAPVLETGREGADFGRLFLSVSGDFGQLTLAGIVDTGWLDGVMDAAVADQRRKFDSTWKDPPEFALWKAPDPGLDEDPTLEEMLSGLKVDLSLEPEQKQLVGHFAKLMGESRRQTIVAEDELRKLPQGSLPAAAHAYLQLAASLRLGRYGSALEQFAALKPSADQTCEVALMHAVLLASARRLAESAAELDVLAREHPQLTAVHMKLVDTLLRLAQPREAREALQRALSALPASLALKELELKVLKAALGPAWKNVYEYQGEHFIVRSETSVKLCRDAVRVLDKAMQRCIFEFGSLPGSRPARSVAYVFGGEASYREYVKGIADKSVENTLGIYSLVLKQVVAWNHPDPERLWDTLRHECMHRYIDLRVGEVPRWLGEGLAETLAAAAQRDESWKNGSLRPEWIELLRNQPGPLNSLGDFANQSEAQFQVNVERSYALSWAWVNFLRFDNAQGRAVFAALWAALAAGVDDATAIEQALEAHDARALQQGFIANLKQLLGS